MAMICYAELQDASVELQDVVLETVGDALGEGSHS